MQRRPNFFLFNPETIRADAVLGERASRGSTPAGKACPKTTKDASRFTTFAAITTAPVWISRKPGGFKSGSFRRDGTRRDL
jgi:hypothetical protein